MAHRFVKGMIAGVGALALGAVAIAAQPGMSEEIKAAKVGEKAPNFTLTDLDGKNHELAKLLAQEDTQAVVLEWFNPGCPFVVKHHQINPTTATLARDYKKRGVKWIAINSGAPGKQGHGIETNKAHAEKWKIQYPILMDESGKVGRMYGAKTTPHMYVIGKDGTLVYAGAIDNNRSPRTVGDVNYVKNALDQHLAGETIAVNSTRPYGCSVKYGPMASNPSTAGAE